MATSTGMAAAIDRAETTGVADIVATAETVAATGDWVRARDALLRAIDKDPKSPDLHGRLAFFTFQAGRAGLPDAQRLVEHHLTQARELGKDARFHLYWSGRIATAEGNQPRARMQFQAALAIAPDFTIAQQAIDRLGEKPKEKVQTFVPRGHAIKKKASLALVVLLVAAGSTSAIFNFMPDMALARLAQSLGLPFPLLSASQVPPNLTIDIGDAWGRMAPATRESDIAAVAERARNMGYRSLVVYSLGRDVIAVTMSDECPNGKCVSLIQRTEKPGPGNITILEGRPATK